MQVRELVTRLGFDADTDQARKYDKTLQDVRRNAFRAAAAVAALAAGTFEVARRMANAGNEVAKSAVEAGMAADEYQRLRFALGQISQASRQDVDRALGRLNQRIGRARREGGKYAEALTEMGFSQEEIASGAVTSERAMDALTRQLGNAKDDMEASAIAGDLLGTRLGRRLGPSLRRNAEAMEQARIRAEELGGGWSEAALSASEDFVDTMGEVGLITTTITSQIAEGLIPAVNEIVRGFVDWWAANREIIQQNLARTIERLGVALRVIRGVVSGFIGAINRGVEALGGWERVIRLLTIAAASLAAVRLARWVWGVSGAILAAWKGGRLLRTILLALSRIPIVAAFSALVLVLEDIFHWVTGGESALKRLFQSFMGFVDGVKNIMPDWMKTMFGANVSAETYYGGGSMPPMTFGRSPADDVASSRSGQVNVNARTEAVLQVPQGTSEEQRRSIEAQAEAIFTQQWDRQMRDAMWNFQPVE